MVCRSIAMGSSDSITVHLISDIALLYNKAFKTEIYYRNSARFEFKYLLLLSLLIKQRDEIMTLLILSKINNNDKAMKYNKNI